MNVKFDFGIYRAELWVVQLVRLEPIASLITSETHLQTTISEEVPRIFIKFFFHYKATILDQAVRMELILVAMVCELSTCSISGFSDYLYLVRFI